jgi:hypothetical protein
MPTDLVNQLSQWTDAFDLIKAPVCLGWRSGVTKSGAGWWMIMVFMVDYTAFICNICSTIYIYISLFIYYLSISIYYTNIHITDYRILKITPELHMPIGLTKRRESIGC